MSAPAMHSPPHLHHIQHARSEDALSALFERVGPVARLVLPPSRGLALVEFCEPQDARSAFKVRGCAFPHGMRALGEVSWEPPSAGLPVLHA